MAWDVLNSLIFFLDCGIDSGHEYEEGITTCALVGFTSRMKEAGAAHSCALPAWGQGKHHCPCPSMGHHSYLEICCYISRWLPHSSLPSPPPQKKISLVLFWKHLFETKSPTPPHSLKGQDPQTPGWPPGGTSVELIVASAFCQGGHHIYQQRPIGIMKTGAGNRAALIIPQQALYVIATFIINRAFVLHQKPELAVVLRTETSLMFIGSKVMRAFREMTGAVSQ